ncbi:MAG: ATP-dependent DNA helicase RecG [Eubacteriales bacterium]|nr:ATP-dependent DNA helicase RecG [Eubacteriales bacterium]MDD4541600.1 ATP-dependent DNA helicase RecG [Eubacteriales bacterium]
MSKRSILDEEVTVLRGISDKRAALFKKLGVKTCEDLIWHLPRDYEDWSDLSNICDLKDDDTACFQANVITVPQVNRRGRNSQTLIKLQDDTGVISAVWFNQPWIAKQIHRGDSLIFRGRIKRAGRYFSVQNPQFQSKGTEVPPLLPIYPLTEGLTQNIIRDAVTQVLDSDGLLFSEFLPAGCRREHQLASPAYAFSEVHFPSSRHAAEVGRRRLSFEELFLIMAGLRSLKSERTLLERQAIILSAEDEAKYLEMEKSLGFELTGSQQNTLAAIKRDFERNSPAYRLIQGDVGSGKTAVAMLAMARIALAGKQSVLMAPTSILAQQHYANLSNFFEVFGIRTGLLLGGMPAARRREILSQVESGEIQCLIGTHALLSDDLIYKQLALCITDEQHRFGVEQRLNLSSKEESHPHVLVMSATPIPRSLAMILYGDMDISEMRDMPAGRQAVLTYTARSKDRNRVENMVEAEIEKGHIAYVVCPAVERSDLIKLESAEEVYKRLKNGNFNHRRLAILHGRLPAKEKDKIMNALSAGEIDILVSTSVIEVGIDQKEATILIVENAERFGLAQLHQMRGRVGRSHYKSFCILMSDSDDELARRRLTALCRHTDGFKIAEEDLRLRGPGDFFGVRQSGLPEFRASDLSRDRELLVEAAGAAEKILSQDPQLKEAENRLILPEFNRRYAERLRNPAM